MSDWIPWYIGTLDIEWWSSEQIQRTITFDSDVQLSPLIILDAQNWKQKLWENSNDNKFLLGCPIVSCSISRRLKLKNRRFEQNQTTITFYTDVRMNPVMYQDACNWKRKLWANSITITFYSDVRINPLIYRDTRNWKRKLWAYSNDNNVLLGCPI